MKLDCREWSQYKLFNVEGGAYPLERQLDACLTCPNRFHDLARFNGKLTGSR